MERISHFQITRKEDRYRLFPSLPRAKLAGLALQGSDFRWVDLSQANLEYSNLSHSMLWAAKLSQASLKNAVFLYSNLRFVRFMEADLTNASLEGADCTGAVFTEANLTGANLTNSNLTEANLTGANLTMANLTNATLTGANLTYVVGDGIMIRTGKIGRSWCVIGDGRLWIDNKAFSINSLETELAKSKDMDISRFWRKNSLQILSFIH